MSPNHIVLLVLAAVVVTFITTMLLLTATTPAPEPKRFGLKQARAAAEIAKATARELGASLSATQIVIGATAKALRGYTVKVLGYEDTVEPELAVLANETAAKNEALHGEANSNNAKITVLKTKIRVLEGENEQLTLDAQANSEYFAEAKADIALFA